MPRLLAAIAIVLVAQGVPALGQNAGQKPDPAALARAGQESIKRFEKESASWTTTTVVRPGIGFVVEVVANLTTRRAVLSVEFQGQREELARITQKDGVWYAKQGNKTGKYRPFEAPLDAPKNSAPDHRTHVTGFRWLKQIDPKEFATDGSKWDDYTDDPTLGDRNDLLMIGHCGAWRPGMPSPEADGRLLDIKTGRYRRIPFQGAMTLPGCFTRDRTSVLVTGVDTTAASWASTRST